MKKVFAILLALVLVVGFACAAPNVAPEDYATPTPEITEEQPGAADEEPVAVPEEPVLTPEPEPTAMPDMEVTSSGIVDGALGLAYGDKGEQFVNSWIPSLSLPLTVNYIPEGTKTLALTMIDPDGGNWVHWLACNIAVDGTSYELQENASIDMADSMVQGKNDFDPVGYGGPTPPSGVHTYVITVYALSDTLALDAGFRLAALQTAMEGLILAEAVVTGTYAH